MTLTELQAAPRQVIWSPEEDAKLIEMRDNEKTMEEIAVHLNRTLTSCKHRWRRLGKTGDKTILWTYEQAEELKVLWLDHSAAECAALLNEKHSTSFTRLSVLGKIRRLGLSSKAKTKCHPCDNYARQEVRALYVRVTRKRAQAKPRITKPVPRTIVRKSKLFIVPSFGGGYRLHESVQGELPFLRCVEVNPLNISLLELTKDTCRWPAEEGPITFCGHKPVEGKPYCAPHCALAYRKPEPHKPLAMKRVAA